MKVLMFSLDRSILASGSRQQKKLLEYTGFLEELHVVLFYWGPRLPEAVRISPRLWVYPTNHRFRSNPWYFFRAVSIARKIAGKRGFDPKKDVLTAQDAFPTGVAAYMMRRLSGIPLQIQVHIDFFKAKFRGESVMNAIQWAISYFIVPRADAVRAVSFEIGDYVAGTLSVPAERITVLPTFSDVNGFADASPADNFRVRYPQHDFFVLVLARLARQKNIDCAIRAMELLRATHPSVALLIVGSGPDGNFLRKAAAASPASSAIYFEPWSQDVVSYYKHADVFLFPSWYEGWGLTVIEAMACGLPVIATRVGCAPSLVEDGHNGYFMIQDDARTAALSIARLYGDPGLRAAIGHTAMETVRQKLPSNKEEYLRKQSDAFKQALYAR